MFLSLISRYKKGFCSWVTNAFVCEKILVSICKIISVNVFLFVRLSCFLFGLFV